MMLDMLINEIRNETISFGVHTNRELDTRISNCKKHLDQLLLLLDNHPQNNNITQEVEQQKRQLELAIAEKAEKNIYNIKILEKLMGKNQPNTFAP